MVTSNVRYGSDDVRLRQLFHVPTEGPLLVLGRPEHYFAYAPPHAGNDDEPTDLRRLLRSAGYPNRFHFLDYSPYASRHDEGAIRDRKTFRKYQRGGDLRRTEDYGFIFLGRNAEGRVILVVTGRSSLGTYAAVELLKRNRDDFANAIVEMNSRREPSCIDIGFHCRRIQLADNRPFPFSTIADHLEISLLNPNDLVGYRWSEPSYKRFAPLMSAWSGRHPSFIKETWSGHDAGRSVEWRWEKPAATATSASAEADGGSVLDVVIAASAYVIGPSQHILPGQLMGALLERVRQDVEADRAEWCDALTNVAHAREETFRPILIVGPTGAGKQWLAEVIASGWGGQTLEGQQQAWSAAKPLDDPNAPLNEGYKELDTLRAGFRDQASGPRALHVFNTPGESPDLMAGHLFGMAREQATNVGWKPGAFLLAGTGVLLLDEFLELEPAMQPQLLLALQNGSVLPIGSGRAYHFACRVVAATNRAESLAGLEQLMRDGKVRRDLVRRFLRLYEVPSLDARSIEIVPTLMMLLVQRFGIDGPPYYFRMSLPAFEALITRHFAENVGDLVRVSAILPPAVIGSVRRATHDVAQHSVTLAHLSEFLRLPSRPADQDGRLETAPRIGEQRFLQFELGFTDVVALGPDPFAQQGDGGWLQFHDTLRGLQPQLVRMRSRADRGISDLGLLLDDAAFAEPLATVIARLQEIHESLFTEGAKAKGIWTARLDAYWEQRRDLAEAMPLHRYVHARLEGRAKVSLDTWRVLKTWAREAITAANARSSTQASQERRRVHAPVLMSVLSGHPMAAFSD
jgi:hypothetical protein